MLYHEANTSICTSFNEDYFRIHNHVYTKGKQVDSRNGLTHEVLSFKTTINKPVQRCVGGYGRNMNVFFLLAEALWIYAGKRDLKFLEIFNSNMREYSDDGVNFHAPYGWRMRHAGLQSVGLAPETDDESLHSGGLGLDQINVALNMLARNPYDRRAVVSLWNPHLDLGANSKDLPCNDLAMFKVRQNEKKEQALFVTIANRSNDLNLGLTTNVFQFSFLLEIMAGVLGVEVGAETHLSDSLHLYMQHETTDYLQKNLMNDMTGVTANEYPVNLYHDADYTKMDFNWYARGAYTIDERLALLDVYVNNIIHLLTRASNNDLDLNSVDAIAFQNDLEGFSKSLNKIYMLLCIYIKYKQHKDKEKSLFEIVQLSYAFNYITLDNDIIVLAMNFFLQRIRKNMSADSFFIFKESLFNNKAGKMAAIIKYLGKY